MPVYDVYSTAIKSKNLNDMDAIMSAVRELLEYEPRMEVDAGNGSFELRFSGDGSKNFYDVLCDAAEDMAKYCEPFSVFFANREHGDPEAASGDWLYFASTPAERESYARLQEAIRGAGALLDRHDGLFKLPHESLQLDEYLFEAPSSGGGVTVDLREANLTPEARKAIVALAQGIGAILNGGAAPTFVPIAPYLPATPSPSATRKAKP